ncbi:hypothetical protein ACFWCF_09340 [Rhodococcus sp. NPDC060090]|uniref:hypothetical protein n=1 Tax=Rhodococcus sp. NPDC060090 TaxID=3347056 RepID=UPI003650E69F
MALSRTWWAATALATAVAAGTTGFVLSSSNEAAPTASPSTYTISTVADPSPTGPTQTTTPNTAIATAYGTGSADLSNALPSGVPFIDTNTCDAWFEDWDDTVPDFVEDFYDEWDDRCDDLIDDDHDDQDDDNWDD